MSFIETIKTWFSEHAFLSEVLTFIGILLLGYIAYLITSRYVLRLIKKIAQKTKTKFDDAIIESRALNRLAYIVPVLIIYNLSFLFPDIEQIIIRLCHTLLVLIFIITIAAFLTGLNKYYETLAVAKDRPIKGYMEISKIVLYVFGSIFIIGLLTGQKPWVLMSGIGALTAVIMLIFRDTILSFVAGIQITSYGLVHVGDWISMPQYGADGDVIDIALHTVKVQNWDKTITMIPTHKLTQDSFKNWRGMTQSGGRRIKRAVHVDLNSIKFCDDEMISRLNKIQMITGYVNRKNEELKKYNLENNIDESVLVNGRRMTNIGTFRAYIEAFIKNHPKVNHNLTSMVRQLPPGPNGLPIEIYVFTNDIVWQNYEAIQADIFDHILAIVPEFGLRIFQNPSGKDFSRIIEK